MHLTRPVTLNPNIGSDDSIECPPAISIFMSLHACLAPSRTALAALDESFDLGQPNIASAIRGDAPIAYISLKALVAAI